MTPTGIWGSGIVLCFTPSLASEPQLDVYHAQSTNQPDGFVHQWGDALECKYLSSTSTRSHMPFSRYSADIPIGMHDCSPAHYSKRTLDFSGAFAFPQVDLWLDGPLERSSMASFRLFSHIRLLPPPLWTAGGHFRPTLALSGWDGLVCRVESSYRIFAQPEGPHCPHGSARPWASS